MRVARVVLQPDRAAVEHVEMQQDRGPLALGFGRIVISEAEVPIIFVNLV